MKGFFKTHLTPHATFPQMRPSLTQTECGPARPSVPTTFPALLNTVTQKAALCVCPVQETADTENNNSLDNTNV
jgi:hypothetical protein